MFGPQKQGHPVTCEAGAGADACQFGANCNLSDPAAAPRQQPGAERGVGLLAALRRTMLNLNSSLALPTRGGVAEWLKAAVC